MKIEIVLGDVLVKGAQAEPAVMDIEELLATRLLVQGNSGSGKSHLLMRILEQSAGTVQQIIVDPEGDFVSLSQRYGHVVIDARRGDVELETIALRVRQSRVSAVLDLQNLEVEGQMRATGIFLNALFDADREHWHPALVVVDEAQLFAPVEKGEFSEDARRLSLGAMTNLMCRGRKRGLAGIIATQRLAKVAKNVAAEASNFLMGRTFLDIDMARAGDLLGMDRRSTDMFRDLGRGHFMALGPALYRRPTQLKVASVAASALGSAPKLTPPPSEVTREEREALLAPVPMAAVRPLAERRAAVPPPPSVNDMLQKIAERREADEAEHPPIPSMPAEEREAILRAIVQEIVANPDNAFADEQKLFNEFSYAHRFKRLPGHADREEFRRLLAFAKAGADTMDASDERWRQALAAAEDVPVEDRTLFLLFARAAMNRAECPPDATVARICGTRSAGRARGMISFLERKGHIAVRAGFRNLRTVAIPALGWETAPGDPNAPDAPSDEARMAAAAE
ncbi:ATP-binding protein [Methylobacterium haplocladii]|uniref:ATP-binding protein n=1 Tax=Methylobacterium haplocladii TaxID=1176176 RepID=A0A512IVH5_9HYPH|nr:ATP-binding protein [Methylobacterium haplocladii]GEP01701.1 ATP-binding protein [Methylobacterium haplocladii]GJD86237.1 hypothetical protein HPGCJGGD_4141 [Methylobacterium haplocladii]